MDGREGSEGGSGDDGGVRRGLQTDPEGLTVGLKSSHQIHD